MKIKIPENSKLPKDFDLFGKVTAKTLEDLIPGIEVVLEYKQSTSDLCFPGLRKITISSKDFPSDI